MNLEALLKQAMELEKVQATLYQGLEKIFDLHDACELAAEVEDYETVAVFEFVHSKFKHDPYRLEISNTIFAHLDKLAGFSDKFKSVDERRRIKVIP